MPFSRIAWIGLTPTTAHHRQGPCQCSAAPSDGFERCPELQGLRKASTRIAGLSPEIVLSAVALGIAVDDENLRPRNAAGGDLLGDRRHSGRLTDPNFSVPQPESPVHYPRKSLPRKVTTVTPALGERRRPAVGPSDARS